MAEDGSTPTPLDISRFKANFLSMSIGEKWETDFAVFEKRNEESLACLSCPANREKELEKIKIICNHLNIKYSDERET